MLVAASPSVNPTTPASSRLKSTFSAGFWNCSWMRGSTNTRDIADLREQLVREGSAGTKVGASDLNVEGRRGTKVEDLGDDIRGKERESCARKSRWQLLPQIFHIDVGGSLPFIQADRYISVEDANRAGTSV